MRPHRSHSPRDLAVALAATVAVASLAGCAAPAVAAGLAPSADPTAMATASASPSPTASPEASATAHVSPSPSPTASPDTTTSPTTSPSALPEASLEPDVPVSSIEPVLTYVGIEAGTLTANAVIPVVVEEGGRCVFTVVSSGTSRTHTTDAIPDAQSTLCAPLSVPNADTETTVTVRYESHELSIQSDPARAGDNS
ncbi:hypothetical protein ON058_03765 [Demequina sp. B12]|uniref:hypothetical protein n=1 Tax=Demequina sp. B12 TaxID=2992757 RepID=UPI00237A184D|nr:hypothetical protein [Demequina sp. B12]MDE0572527.1 hypothetical protein [Demequina sp. B12]